MDHRPWRIAALVPFALGIMPVPATAEPRYDRDRYFPRRTFDLIAHAGIATPAQGLRSGFVGSGTLFLRLSPIWGGPSLALDLVQRSRDTGPARTDFLLYLSHRIAFTKLPRVEPWLEPIGIGLGFYRPAVGVDAFVVSDVRLGCAAKLPIFFLPNTALLEVGIELTVGFTVQLGSTTTERPAVAASTSPYTRR